MIDFEDHVALLQIRLGRVGIGGDRADDHAFERGGYPQLPAEAPVKSSTVTPSSESAVV